MIWRFPPRLSLLLVLLAPPSFGQLRAEDFLPGQLEKTLLQESAEKLAAEAAEYGDARRGAVVFFQSATSCGRCHLPEEGATRIGPDLARLDPRPAAAEIVEAVLHPSRKIRPGFETAILQLTDGRALSGLLVGETPAELTLAVSDDDLRLRTIARAEVDAVKREPLSVMPVGLANLLTSRQQFLDLVRYVQEVVAGGPAKAAELRPAPELLAAKPLPEYESRVDHAGLIAALDEQSLERGRAIYDRTCANCHGAHDREGSLPTSLKFASGKFKNGYDPFRLYQTLTHGFGFMPAQTWMVPSQKYDVIHYLREAYLKPRNPTQYAAIDAAYLASLPPGDTRGPEPQTIEPWVVMDYGPSLIGTYEFPGLETLAYKGVAVRLDQGPGGVSRGAWWAAFDHDTLRCAAVWSGEGFIDWRGIHFNGEHQAHPRAVGEVQFGVAAPGWANPQTGRFDDSRLQGRDGKPYGPLPRSWARYLGMYVHGQQTVFSYTVGQTSILESFGQTRAPFAFTRTLNIGPRQKELLLRAADGGDSTARWKSLAKSSQGQTAICWGAFDEAGNSPGHGLAAAGIAPAGCPAEWESRDGALVLRIPAGEQPLRFTVWMKACDSLAEAEQIAAKVQIDQPERNLEAWTGGGPARYPQPVTTMIRAGEDSGPFAVDELTLPIENPWLCQMRPSGLDFFEGGDAAAVCTWDGDVWRVENVSAPQGELVWRRIASGLFQPLGLKIVGGKIHVTCRDQLVVLHDLNGDLETDFYQCLNNDHQVTEHFHEFAMGLETDGEGNFYYAKSARHALPAIVPHHGTLLKILADGTRTEILATGFRAANGVCLNDDGTFFVTDQEGHWIPKNRINWVKPGGFYGNMFGYHDVTDSSDEAMAPPLCYITNAFDRSPGELRRVPGKAWAPLDGALIELSYGTGKIFVVPHEKVGGQMQGGLSPLPIPAFPTGVMRGRFHPVDGQLYACGMFAWAGDRTAPGGLYRIRRTRRPLHAPVGLRARKSGLEITFSSPLDAAAARDVRNFAVRVWSLKRTANYGSAHYDERPLRVTSASLSADRRTVRLSLPEIGPTWCMAISYSLSGAGGEKVEGEIHNTIHQLGP